MEKRISTLAVASVALRQWMGHHRGSGGILCEFGCVSREAVVVVGVPRPHQIQSSKRRCLCFATQRNLWENGKSSAEVPRLPACLPILHIIIVVIVAPPKGTQQPQKDMWRICCLVYLVKFIYPKLICQLPRPDATRQTLLLLYWSVLFVRGEWMGGGALCQSATAKTPIVM